MGFIKVIHWEYNPKHLGSIAKDKSRLLMYIGSITNPRGNLTGFFLRWSCRVFSDLGQTIGFTGEQYYTLDLNSLNRYAMALLIEKSFINCQTEINSRLEGMDLNLSFPINENVMLQVDAFLENPKAFLGQ